MDLSLILYFIVGIIQDFLWTINLKFIIKNKILLAGSSSVIATIVMMVVLYSILTRLEEQRSLVAIVIYALGIGTGTMFAMKFKLK